LTCLEGIGKTEH